jgi:hypothetical protein
MSDFAKCRQAKFGEIEEIAGVFEMVRGNENGNRVRGRCEKIFLLTCKTVQTREIKGLRSVKNVESVCFVDE